MSLDRSVILPNTSEVVVIGLPEEERQKLESELSPEDRGLVASLEKGLEPVDAVIEEKVGRAHLERFWKMIQEIFLPSFQEKVNQIVEMADAKGGAKLRFNTIIPGIYNFDVTKTFFSSMGMSMSVSPYEPSFSGDGAKDSLIPWLVAMQHDFRQYDLFVVTFEYSGRIPTLFNPDTLTHRVGLSPLSNEVKDASLSEANHTFEARSGSVCYRIYLLSLKLYACLTQKVLTDQLVFLTTANTFPSPCAYQAYDRILLDIYQRTISNIKYSEKTREFYFF